jgi:hypothetical protein
MDLIKWPMRRHATQGSIDEIGCRTIDLEPLAAGKTWLASQPISSTRTRCPTDALASRPIVTRKLWLIVDSSYANRAS